jgi:SAM-dependent methyltransferase
MSTFKSRLRKALPQSAIERLRFMLVTLPRLPEAAFTRRVFLAAPRAPAYLEYQDLERLQHRYPAATEYGYGHDAVEQRGAERCTQLLRLPGATTAHRFLELGCWDGMVSAALCAEQKDATALDSRSDGFDERARRSGVKLMQMDAAALNFPDNSFDFVFSYDAFEHFPSPDRVLQEALRVARPGAHVYLEFGPLYFAPYGEHAYRTIRVPYCQFLFSRTTLNEYSDKAGLERINFHDVNRLSLHDYRAIWQRCASVAERVHYIETADLSHLALVREYPSCFRSKSDDFENFTVSSISVLLRKKATAS